MSKLHILLSNQQLKYDNLRLTQHHFKTPNFFLQKLQPKLSNFTTSHNNSV